MFHFFSKCTLLPYTNFPITFPLILYSIYDIEQNKFHFFFYFFKNSFVENITKIAFHRKISRECTLCLFPLYLLVYTYNISLECVSPVTAAHIRNSYTCRALRTDEFTAAYINTNMSISFIRIKEY